MKIKKTLPLCFYGTLLVVLNVHASGLELIEDEQLSNITAQDGLIVKIEADNINVGALYWSVTDGASTNRYNFNGFNYSRIGNNGAPALPTDKLSFVSDIDIGSSAGGTPALSINASWPRTRHKVDSISHADAPTKSIATAVFDSAGSVSFFNTNGIFDSTTNNLKLSYIINDGEIYWRQGVAGSPEMLLDNFNFALNITNGRLGVDANGIRLQALSTFGTPSTFNLDWSYDVKYRSAPLAANEFRSDSAVQNTMYFGLVGNLADFDLYIKPGGVYTNGNTASRGNGINFSLNANADPNFQVRFGESKDLYVALTDWSKLNGATRMLTIPDWTIDLIDAGQGPGGLCWGANTNNSTACVGAGGTLIDVAPEDNAISITARDISYFAYPRKVILHDITNSVVDESFNWGIITTLGNLDGNVYWYAGGPSGANTGLKMDINFMAQSFDTSANKLNTHFMIMDTDTNKAIGLFDANLGWRANDMYLQLLPAGINLSSNDVSFRLSGVFGGGDFPFSAANNPIRVSNWDLLLDADKYDLTLKPAASADLGFDLKLNLVNTSYFSLAEPSAPTSTLKFDNIQGSLRLDGKLDFISNDNTPINESAKMVVSTDIYLGTSVPGVGYGNVLSTNLKLSGNPLMDIVIPSGQWYSSITLKEQCVSAC